MSINKMLEVVLPMLSAQKSQGEEPAAYDFSEALIRLKLGRRVRRKGWAGTEMWLLHIPAKSWNWTIVALTAVHPLAWIALRTADGEFVPWTPSHADILAEDWIDG